MSVQAIGWVLDHSRASGPARLVMVSLANHANDDGHTYPGVGTIAREAGISARTVQRHVHHLVTTGELRPVGLRPGRYGPMEYVLPAMEGRHSVTPRPESPGHKGRHSDTRQADTRQTARPGVTAVADRTNKEPKTPSRGTRLPDREHGGFQVTAAMREWAAREVPDLDVVEATREFCDYWRAVPGQRGTKLDWVATWRNSLRMYARQRASRGRGSTTAPPPNMRG